MTDALWTPGRALQEYARQRPDETVLLCAGDDGSCPALTRRELDEWTSRLAHRLQAEGAGRGRLVAIVLPTCIEHMVAVFAAYKAGATPFPVSNGMPPAERDAMLALADPVCVISDQADLQGITRADMAALDHFPATLPQAEVPNPIKAVGSGGSTGKPKLIVTPGDFAFADGQHPMAALLRMDQSDLKYSPGPLYHNGPLLFSIITLFIGGRVLLNARFRAQRALDLIEQYRPTVLNLVPTMMQRMLREADMGARDLSSVKWVWHLAAPCPAWAKLGFVEHFGGERVLELWAATESTGLTVIDGNDWLAHRGSVGQGVMTEFRIVDEQGQDVPTGEVGEIFSRFLGVEAQYEYRGAEPLRQLPGGYTSVGDMGYLDADGYLYLSDRRTDMIISGGANIFPAEIEAVISAHPAVRDVAVIGLPDEDLGRRVHAVVEPIDSANPPSPAALAAHCEAALARYKVPRGFELVAELPRNEAGKIRRGALRDERGG
ncbi:AMP-binding protein [Parahaliea mediterranea]|uniref:AMP-binding protein n=1 Tax=Parahaliea mediterranea TaxID=651086 RepID=UPI000E2FEF35|nr:AMP-binding protein [Parahaliea mediterranea]